jgi:hypothetical protein
MTGKAATHRRLVPAALRVLALLAFAACGGGGARPGAEATAGPSAASALDVGRTAAAAPCPADTIPAAEADIAFDATVRIESLEHRERPRTRVAFPGETPADTLSCDARRNLERPVRAGRTYRDVQLDYRLRVRLDTAAVLRAIADSAAAVPDTARRP